MLPVNPNGAENRPDFSTARRFVKRSKIAYNGEVYATDLDGIQYRFETVEKAAHAVIENGYYTSRKDTADAISKARCLIRMSIRANNKKETKDSRFAGFEWRDHLTIR